MPSSPISEAFAATGPVAVVGHDAGASNLILGWLRQLPGIELRPCFAGPALALWQRESRAITCIDVETALDGAALLVSGTSYADDTEHRARRLARKRGVRSAGVIDHWVNYAGRFSRGGEDVLPDEIWVADEYAAATARETFIDTPVRQLPNSYLDGLAAEVRAIAACSPRGPGRRILYVLEPIRAGWTAAPGSGEFEALDFTLQRLAEFGLLDGAELRLRPHPSDPPGKYDAWLSAHPGLAAAPDPSPSLAAAIAWADLVIGCETYALVVAAAAGRQVLSSLPPQAPRCRLPIREIIHLRDMTNADSLSRAR